MMKRILREYSYSDLFKWGFRRGIGRLSSKFRRLPDFIIIGVQRGGTTSLFKYISQHPEIYPAYPKEIHFFSNNYKKGTQWYKSHFPLSSRTSLNGVGHKNKLITGEATPYYIYHPLAPKRVFETLPNVRLILLLRNPVDRAYSHYHHEVKMGVETLSFEDAIDKESQRIANEKDKLLKDCTYKSFNCQHFSYLDRGIYIDQIRTWHRYFDREQICVIQSEWLNEHPFDALKRVVDFLDLPDWKMKVQRKYHRSNYLTMDDNTRKRLRDYFEPYNQSLYEYLNQSFSW